MLIAKLFLPKSTFNLTFINYPELPRSFKLSVIRVGEWDLDQDIDCEGSVCAPPPQDIEVEEVIFHENYGKPKAFQNDIAVIKLKKNVTENAYVSPICLPYDDDDETYQVRMITPLCYKQ